MKLYRQSALRSLAAIAAALVVGTPPPVAESFVPALVFPPTRSTTTTTTTTTSPPPSSSSSSSSSLAPLVFALKSSLLDSLPSVEELSKDPFMKQVGYGSELAVALKKLRGTTEAEQASLRASLEAQLSHSDGIRGFMVAYLTGIDSDGDSDSANGIADETDPEILLETLHGLLASPSNSDDLVSLMCMNVVMPVAMITMHQDPALSEASRMTAARGGRLLASVFGASPSIRSNASAIRAAANGGSGDTNKDSDSDSDSASDNDVDPKLVDYWTEFFGKWGYQDAQTKDIAATMNELLESSSS